MCLNFALLSLHFVVILLGTVHLSHEVPLVTVGYGKQDYPFVDYISINPDNVIFYLYPDPLTNPGDNEFDILTHGDLASIEDSRYNPKLPITLLIHGFTQDLLTDFPQDLIKAYVHTGFASHKANIVAVDWGQLSAPRIASLNNADYKYVLARTIPIVSQRVSDFLQFLIHNNKLSGPEDVHIIGQSLGAHVSGGAGAKVHQDTGKLIKRITGTDPAGPLFQDQPPNERLDTTDAHFVDVVHTDQGGLGYNGSLGHVDFFVNGGIRVQPGCENESEYCSHNKAPKYYAESVYFPSMTACADEAQASNCPIKLQIPFGESCRESSRGNYYLTMIVD